MVYEVALQLLYLQSNGCLKKMLFIPQLFKVKPSWYIGLIALGQEFYHVAFFGNIY